jgi:hypothetical protein
MSKLIFEYDPVFGMQYRGVREKKRTGAKRPMMNNNITIRIRDNRGLNLVIRRTIRNNKIKS